MAKTMLIQGKDQNGKRLSRDIRQEEVNGQLVWGVSVWFGGFNNSLGTNLRRIYFQTREQARNADISMEIGTYGRVA